MEKREKIMLAVMGTAIVGGLAVQFSGGGGAKAPQGPMQTQAGTAEINKALAQAKLTKDQEYRIALVAGNSTLDPFYGGKDAVAQADEPGEGGGMVYSGYIKVGDRVYAVINGIEYATGDPVAEGDYKVRSIDKDRVLLERTDGSTGRKFTKSVPLVEDDTDKIRIRVVKKR